MIYDVSHRTTYRYSIPVSFSHHLLHLTPRPSARQNCQRTALVVEPTPSKHTSATDYFGNGVTYITIQEQHQELILHAKSIIAVQPALPVDPDVTMPWDRVYDTIAGDTSAASLEVLQYVFESPLTQISPELRAFAQASFPPGRPMLAGALDLTARIFKAFTYNPTATTVMTPVDEVFAKRQGVCQDFAHLQISVLRALRLPARYVSGYLMTRPPEGREKLIGADASHAWVALWCPEYGWVELDPTNNLLVSDEHITLGWGRDFGDVSPVKGAIFGGGTHSVEVAVDVVAVAGTTPTATGSG